MATQKIHTHTHTEKQTHTHILNKQKVTHNNKIVSVMEKRNLHISVYLPTIDCFIRLIVSLGRDLVTFKHTLVIRQLYFNLSKLTL